MTLIKRIQGAVVLQSRNRCLVVCMRCQRVRLLEQTIGFGEAPLIRYLQRQMHQRIDSVGIVSAKRALLQCQRGTKCRLSSGEILGEVGARTDVHQTLILADIAGTVCVRRQLRRKQQIGC